MTENVGEVLRSAVQKMAHQAVQEKLNAFKTQIQEVVLATVEEAFKRFPESEAFKQALKENMPAAGEISEEKVCSTIVENLSQNELLQKAIHTYFAEHKEEILNDELLKNEIDKKLLEKAKELFKRSVFSGSLDIKKAITKAVENTLAAKGLTAGIQEDLGEQLRQQLKNNLGDLLKRTISEEVRRFFSSDELKELLDSKFRAIDLYLKTEVIPKVVKKEIAKALQEAQG